MSDSGDSRRLVVGPFNRVEGDLEVHLDIADGVVRSARVNAPLYRGFENLLLGRPMADALVLVPRICGICSVSQSAAAAAALAQLSGATMPANGRLATNLILASEVLVDHLTHFYLFFAPDFAREAYAGHPWHAAAQARFAAVHGQASRDFLPARAKFLALVATLAGKWPHTLALRPGGTTRPLLGGERVRLQSLLRGFRGFVERHYFGGDVETFIGLSSGDALRAWSAGRDGDLPRWLAWADALGLDRLGIVRDGLWLSSGAYPHPADGSALFPAGTWSAVGGLGPFSPDLVREDVTHARLRGGADAVSPAIGLTEPDLDKPGAYTWCKAPRYGGRVAETGALARQLVAGQTLIRELANHGGNVTARIVARAVEVARLIEAMETWLAALDPDAPYLAPSSQPDEGRAVASVEAARGTLSHWLSVRKGAIEHYQIVAPTTWNFSPRDAGGAPGPLEQALQGIVVQAGDETPVSVQHVVRSFDPCMVCTVH